MSNCTTKKASTTSQQDGTHTSFNSNDNSNDRNSSRPSLFRIKSTWSKAGVGTCIILETYTGKTKIVFDLGATPIFDDTISSSVVILSHGHIDHAGGIFNHARAHSVVHGGSTPSYYVPEEIRPKIEQMRQVMSDLDATCMVSGSEEENNCHRNESLMKMNIIGVRGGDEIELKQRKSCGSRLFLRPFNVNHGGHPALGYAILSKTPGGLKEEYMGLPSLEIRNLIQSGVQIKKDDVVKVEVTYTGDTCAAGIMNPFSLKNGGSAFQQQEQQRSDLYLQQAFTAPLIFCELTFLDVHDSGNSTTDFNAETKKKKKKKQKSPTVLDRTFATERGHMHIQDIVPIFTSHGWDILDGDRSSDVAGGGEDCNGGVDATACMKLSSSCIPAPIHVSNGNKKKVVFFHVSGRHAPATRALDQIVQSGLIPPKLLKCCSVAISSFITEKDDDKGQDNEEVNCNENKSWLSLVGDDGCISLLDYVKYLERC